jgi:uncharacterized protein YbgA (DUF1722 family)
MVTPEPPPTNEAEEIKRRSRISLRELVEWYREHHLPLDVPLTDYRPMGE